MPGFEALRQLILADFRERTRRYSFLVIMLGTLFFGFLVITGKWALTLGDYRGEYNSAWVGSLMGGASTMMLGFFGFYLVKNSLSRDRFTRVGQIIAATPLSNLGYVISKFVSNFVVLTTMAAVLAASAVVMQLLGDVEGGFSLWDLLAPFLFYCLPVMTIVAAAAVLFESSKWLRGTLGNILYLFIAEFAFINHLFFYIPLLDFSGFGLFIPSMQDAALAAYPGAKLGTEFGFIGYVDSMSGRTMNFFSWEGIDWSIGMLPTRLVWIGCALGLAGWATFNFDRFDPALHGRKKSRKKTKRGTAAVVETAVAGTPAVSWGDITAVKLNFNFVRMLNAELRLMIKGYHWSWYLIAAGLIAVQSAVPYQYARAYALPAAWIWPLAMWSAMGTREARFNTGQLLFSSVRPVSRQFPVTWIAGVVITLLTGAGMILRSLMTGNVEHAAALLAGAVFIPSLALALGSASGTKKLFEVMYLLIWYVGPVNQLVPLDFMGATPEAAAGPNSPVYLASGLVLLVIAFLLRRRRVIAGSH